ncbi:MBL fold metallo-hydrolase [Terriglobus albidus]|uniref:MBL fold metallo-hydrolase n=1 Tax=Terriglobus albidus TaxID=1592106 RepID=A0A5B9EFV3_9BACT|nr:MBL fold metallo-hydrolase [Terriglobus albidus]QEE29217.1 MBL fold metallo-hydrolase [Terriglobus albidus]
MIRETFPVGLLGCNCTILGDNGEGIVVDPGDDIPRITAALTRHGLTCKQIIVTHAHIDHIAAAQTLKRLTGAPVYYNQLDLPLVKIMDIQAGWLGIPTPEVAPPDADAGNGMKVRFGATEGAVLHTPGHTEGSLVLHIPGEKLLLAGDTLFAGSIGRTDLPGGDYPTILRSIHDVLLPLPDETLVIPGHGKVTTIGAEREDNPFLK